MTVATSASELRAALGKEREATGKQPTKRVFADFHIHTRFSRDSILSEQKFIEKAIERGLTHVCVTNHNNVEGAVAVRDKVAELGLTDKLTVILGEEVSTADGEVVGVFLTKTIPRGLSANETADEIHRQGGPGQHPPPVRSVPRLAHQGGPAAQPRRDRQDRHGRGLQLPGDASSVTTRRPPSSRPDTASRASPRPTLTPASRSRWPSTPCPPFETAEELKALLPENEWHASRSTVFIHATTRWAVWKNMFDAWRGKPAATGPILGPEPPEQVRQEPVQRPTGAELPDKEPEPGDDGKAGDR